MIMALLLVTSVGSARQDVLPKYMTHAESLRIDEIGKTHVVTAPPGGWVETPAEFERVRGVWVTWLYGSYNSIERSIVREVVDVCKAYIIPGAASETTSIKSYLTGGGVPLDSVRFFIFPNNSIWMRDYGPWFIRRQDGSEGIVDFQYNRPRPLDDTIPWRIGQAFGIPVYGSPLEHPGGNFMVDGLGRGFFSNLIYSENPGYSTYAIDTLMRSYNGLELTTPLRRIQIEYTGHIDLWTKILNDTLVMVGEYASGHPNDTVLDNRADSITRCRNREGFPYRVVRMVMPWSTSNAPPTYLNSLIVNDKVLVPTWGLAEDPLAIATYQAAMPGYEIVGINCSAMSGSGGAIHCITMQMPAAQYLHVRHYPYPDTYDTLNPYRIRCRIISSASLVPESTLVYYKIGANGTYATLVLNAVVDTPGVYATYIPQQPPGDTVFYYLVGRNTHNIRRTAPDDMPPHIFSFRILGDQGVVETGGKALGGFTLYPNPAREFIRFSFETYRRSPVRIEIFNVLGRRVRIFSGAEFAAGSHALLWNLDDDGGRRLAAGIYFCRVESADRTMTGKFLVLKQVR